ncbi:MAG: DUF3348 family protein, partial [Thermomonas sp.]
GRRWPVLAIAGVALVSVAALALRATPPDGRVQVVPFEVRSAPEEGARLAGLDAQLEAVLAPREAALFAAVPARLAEAAAGMGAQALRDLLLAELDARLLPVDGLLAALRPR